MPEASHPPEDPARLTLPLTPAERSLVTIAGRFANKMIAPIAESLEREKSPLPAGVVAEWIRLGLNGMQVSPERGGAGASFFTRVAVAEAIARACFPCAFALINMQGAVTRIESEGTAEQIAHYLPGLMKGSLICAPSLSEPEAGSDFGAIRTLATKVPGGWEISGEKAWVTNGTIANLLVMYAQTEPGAGGKGIASFIVDLQTAGIEKFPAYDLIWRSGDWGMRHSPSARTSGRPRSLCSAGPGFQEGPEKHFRRARLCLGNGVRRRGDRPQDRSCVHR